MRVTVDISDIDSQRKFLEEFAERMLRSWIPDGDSPLTHGPAPDDGSQRVRRRSSKDAALLIPEFSGTWRLALTYEAASAKAEKGFHYGHVHLNEELYRLVTAVRSLMMVQSAMNMTATLSTLDTDVVFWWPGSICASRASWNGQDGTEDTGDHARAEQLKAACLL